MDCGVLCGDCAELTSCAVAAPLGVDEKLFLSGCALSSRALILDMLAEAGTGHMAMALGCAEIGAVLFGKFLRCDGAAPGWIDRDRFVLSAGHGSAFLYSWLHLAGFAVSTDDLRQFRRGGKARSHPEFCRAMGVECTTGPLGQGIGNAVGMALSQQLMAAHFADDVHMLHGRTVCLAGDGCMHEGVALEALILAGLWELGNLILIYDDNGITLDGPSRVSNGRNCKAMLSAIGWSVQEIDGHDLDQISMALNRARAFPGGKPQAIIAKTLAAKGVESVAGTHRAHGLPLGKDELLAAKRVLAPECERFTISERLQNELNKLAEKRKRERVDWQERFSMALERNSKLLEVLSPKKFGGDELVAAFPKFGDEQLATRKSGNLVLQKIAEATPNLISVGADVFSSVGTAIGDGPMLSADNTSVRNVQCGAREHAMGAIANGLAFDGIFRPLASTFLVFSDYLRPAMRMGAMAKLPIIYVFSHDSIAVGEDGPTHQPVEMLPSLRAIPNFDVVRPADSEECVGAYALAIDNSRRPTAMILSRQQLPQMSNLDAKFRRDGARRGGYIVRSEKLPLKSILLASGSEVHLALAAAEEFPHCRVVSMPCMEVFERQSLSYRESVIDVRCSNLFAVEAAGPQSWLRYVPWGNVIAVNEFGDCLDGDALMAARGISVENICKLLQRVEGEK